MLATSNSGVLPLLGRQDRAMALASRARRPPRPVPRAPLGPAVALGNRMDLCPLQRKQTSRRFGGAVLTGHCPRAKLAREEVIAYHDIELGEQMRRHDEAWRPDMK